MLIRRAFLALSLVAVAWFVATPEASASRPASADASCAASPSTPEALAAVDRALPGTGPAGSCDEAPSDFPHVVTVASSSKPSRESALIEARVLEKYGSFRESLRTP